MKVKQGDVWESDDLRGGWEDTLEKEMATHFIIFPWEILWTEVPSGPQSMGLQKESDITEWLHLLMMIFTDKAAARFTLMEVKDLIQYSRVRINQ